MVSKRKSLGRKLMDAVLMRDLELTRELLRQGAPVDARDPEHDETPLMLAAMAGDDRLVRLLLESGADVEARDHRRRTALFFAAVGSPSFEALVAAGADVHARDSDGDTLLLHAVEKLPPVQEVDRLLALGVEPSVMNVGGESALGIAEYLGLTEVAERLRLVTRSN